MKDSKTLFVEADPLELGSWYEIIILYGYVANNMYDNNLRLERRNKEAERRGYVSVLEMLSAAQDILPSDRTTMACYLLHVYALLYNFLSSCRELLHNS